MRHHLVSMHAVNRRTIDCRVRSKIPGMSAMLPAATVILAIRFSSVSTAVSTELSISHKIRLSIVLHILFEHGL